MRRTFGNTLVANRLILLFFFIAFILVSTRPLSAKDIVLQGGTGFTFQTPMLFGLAATLNWRGDAKTDSWFSDTQLIYHWLTSVTEAKEGNATAKITFRSLELNWFYLVPISTQGSPDFFWGPGIGYGVAEVEEDISSGSSDAQKDPSKFFSASDIHYGTLILKFGLNWSNKTCEGRLSSFGGLIGGTVVCGIIF